MVRMWTCWAWALVMVGKETDGKDAFISPDCSRSHELSLLSIGRAMGEIDKGRCEAAIRKTPGRPLGLRKPHVMEDCQLLVFGVDKAGSSSLGVEHLCPRCGRDSADPLKHDYEQSCPGPSPGTCMRCPTSNCSLSNTKSSAAGTSLNVEDIDFACQRESNRVLGLIRYRNRAPSMTRVIVIRDVVTRTISAFNMFGPRVEKEMFGNDRRKALEAILDQAVDAVFNKVLLAAAAYVAENAAFLA